MTLHKNMKISWNWLSQSIDLKGINQSELAEKLTLAGFEVENIIHKKDIQDTTLDISITANRLDIISLASIAVEIAAILNRPLTLYENVKTYQDEIKHKKLNYVNNHTIYKKIHLSIIEQLPTNNSPQWLQDYLIASDINPTKSILDIIYFINFKWGQSIKIFKINTNKNTEIKKLKSFYTKEHSEQNRSNKIDIVNIQSSALEVSSQNIHNYQTTNIDVMILGSIYNNNAINDKPVQQCLQSTKYLSYAYIEAIYLIHKIYKHNIDNKIIYEYENKQTNTKTVKCNLNSMNKILGPIKSKQDIKYLNQTI